MKERLIKLNENFEDFSSRNCIVRFSNGSSTDSVGIVNDLIYFIDN